jgi:hypothetical protein
MWGVWGAEVIGKGGSSQWVPIWTQKSGGLWRPAKDRPDAIASRTATIQMSGLAKAAWLWPTKKYGPSGIGFAANPARLEAVKQSATSSNFTGEDIYISLTNKLDYIRQAMSGGENSAVTALARAGRMMSQNIDSKLKKMAASI